MSVEFRYFAYPHEFASFSTTPAKCDFCGEERPHYSGSFYGPDDERETICEECLVSGRLEPLEMTTNSGNIATLRRQLSELRPELSAEERERVARERTAEVEARTPSLQTWQYFDWPVHCGDYCQYIKEVGQPELAAIAPDGDGPSYLVAHASGWGITNIELARKVWEDIRPDTPTDISGAYSVGIYLFACLSCGEHIIMWDCD